MIADLLKVVYPLALVSQTLWMLRLRIEHGRASFASRMKGRPDGSR
jgi:hypothetical protein